MECSGLPEHSMRRLKVDPITKRESGFENDKSRLCALFEREVYRKKLPFVGST